VPKKERKEEKNNTTHTYILIYTFVFCYKKEGKTKKVK
jgi:hypothetical protein